MVCPLYLCLHCHYIQGRELAAESFCSCLVLVYHQALISVGPGLSEANNSFAFSSVTCILGGGGFRQSQNRALFWQ